jgi:hypothetical protein
MSDTNQPIHRFARGVVFRKAGLAAVAAFLLTGAGLEHWALSGEPAPQTVLATSASLLDGRTFHGEILDDKGTVRAKDVLTFKGGKFHSLTCEQLGFGESPYWIRLDGESIHFLVETASPESGEMRFAGTVRGDEVEAQGVWTKQRWYWSIRREIRFKATEKK